MKRRDDLDLDYFKNLLLDEKSKIERILEGIEQETNEIANSASDAEDRGDIATLDYSNELDTKEIKRLESELAEIKHALKKINDGTYGICEKTGEPIPKERLEIYPSARTIVGV